MSPARGPVSVYRLATILLVEFTNGAITDRFFEVDQNAVMQAVLKSVVPSTTDRCPKSG
jgi:hypothetical protein